LPLRTARGRGDLDGPCFNLAVPPNGYAWWYIDGISDDGTKAISIIAFIGSVFSPWYRWSGRKDPEDHCCLNVVTYGKGGRWTMTDRGRDALELSETQMKIGPSHLSWDGSALTIHIDERTTPHGGRLRGKVTLTPRAVTNVELPLCDDGAHIWRPFAPVADIQVRLENAGWSWFGHGYFDANFGTRALEEDFDYWTWGRFPTREGACCFYDATRCDGSNLAAAIAFDETGKASPVDAPRTARFKSAFWGVRRETRADPDFAPHEVRPMLDAPFYNRAMVRTKINGETVTGVHESLDLSRFRKAWMMPMLAFRVPRRKNWPKRWL
jgi:carotenoid 1,2-hydratase